MPRQTKTGQRATRSPGRMTPRQKRNAQELLYTMRTAGGRADGQSQQSEPTKKKKRTTTRTRRR